MTESTIPTEAAFELNGALFRGLVHIEKAKDGFDVVLRIEFGSLDAARDIATQLIAMGGDATANAYAAVEEAALRGEPL